MPAMNPTRAVPARSRPLGRLAAASAAALACLALLSPGSAQARHHAKETYIFLVSRVDLHKGMPATLRNQVLTRVGAAIEAHPDLEAKLPAGAPDPKAAPKKFIRYLKARHRSAFKVNIEVTAYSQGPEANPADKTGQYLTTRITLRMFGETVPKRTMAFTGNGSATVKLGVSMNIRARDRDEGTSEALDQATAQAIAESLRKLKMPPPTKRKKHHH